MLFQSGDVHGTVLGVAMQSGHEKIIRYLLERVDSNVNAKDPEST